LFLFVTVAAACVLVHTDAGICKTPGGVVGARGGGGGDNKKTHTHTLEREKQKKGALGNAKTRRCTVLIETEAAACGLLHKDDGRCQKTGGVVGARGGGGGGGKETHTHTLEREKQKKGALGNAKTRRCTVLIETVATACGLLHKDDGRCQKTGGWGGGGYKKNTHTRTKRETGEVSGTSKTRAYRVRLIAERR
jgi:hypothetical protein